MLCVFCTVSLSGQTRNARFVEYIERYSAVALEHERSHGVPASITLAQGLLESNAGRSYLARRGNNHFGIKCHSTWHGPSVEFDDTLAHPCYRKYGSPEDSFLDHARFLSTRRYMPLHELDPGDYRGWAQGLLDCGYAEDPAYPQKLVALIEQYRLQDISIDSQVKPREAPVDALGDADGEKQKSAFGQPSAAQVDEQVARRRSARERLRRAFGQPTTNASPDN